MRVVVVVLRTLAVVLTLAAVIATYATAARPVLPWNFFGFFTVQSNLIAVAALAGAAVAIARGRSFAPLFRGAATAYVALTGIVYNTLLTGVTGGVALPWANVVLHSVIPAYAVLDWAVVRDRPPLAWRRLWVVVPYPVVWLVVVLVRGATDGWVPYPFLDPDQGYGVVAAYCAAITAVVLVLSSAVWGLSRVRLPLLPLAR